MIEIIIKRKNDRYYGFHSRGHAGEAKKPLPRQEIVCAAVSVLTQNTVNALEYFLLAENISYQVSDGDLKLVLEDSLAKDADHTAQVLLQALYLGLKNLEDSYPKYMKVKIQEVD